MKYILLPFVAWVISGSIKFLINEIRFGKGRELQGYGGLPSTHTTIISSAVFFYGFSESFFTPTFTLGLSVMLLFIMDAHNLRIKIGKHAEILNKLQSETVLRERMGHTWLEIFCGLILGAGIGYVFANFL